MRRLQLDGAEHAECQFQKVLNLSSRACLPSPPTSSRVDFWEVLRDIEQVEGGLHRKRPLSPSGKLFPENSLHPLEAIHYRLFVLVGADERLGNVKKVSVERCDQP